MFLNEFAGYAAQRLLVPSWLIGVFILIFVGFARPAVADSTLIFPLNEPDKVSGFADSSPDESTLSLLLEPGETGVLEYSAQFSVVQLSKICVHFNKADYLRSLGLQLLRSDRGWQDYGVRHFYWALSNEPSCFAVSPGAYHGLRLKFTGGGGNIPQSMTATITSSELSVASWIEGRGGTVFLAALVALMLVVPGILLTVLFSGPDMSNGDLLARIFPWAVLFYVVCYVGLWASQGPDIYSGQSLLWLWVVLIDLLIVFAALRHGVGEFATLIVSLLPMLLIYFLVVMGVSGLISHGLPLPIWELDFQWMNDGFTYGAFHAHDPVLHYVNGRAIADNEPFTQYYSNRRLMFYVEDRGILPGVMAAVYRQIMGELIGLSGRSYAVYAYFAIACQTMLIFPVAAFVRRYIPERKVLFVVLAVSLNAFVLVNFYLAWFKLAAAGLFLSGLLILLENNNSLRNWIFAGVSWGLAANAHSGSALMIPLFFLWQSFSLLRHQFAKGLIYPLILALAFVSTMAPWSIVKAKFYPDSHALLVSHYLGGRENPDGLLASAQQLFDEVPVDKQLKVRGHKMENSLRITEVKQIYELFRDKGWRAAISEWNLREFRYTAFVLYPFLLIALMAVLLGRHREQEIFHVELRFERARCRIMLWLSFTTLLILLFAAYGRHDPDLTYHLPMALPVLMTLLLVTIITRGPVLIRGLLLIWLIFSVWRLMWPYF